MSGLLRVQYKTAFNGLRFRPFGMVVLQVGERQEAVIFERHLKPLRHFGSIAAQPFFKFYVDIDVITQNSLSKNHHHKVGALLVKRCYLRQFLQRAAHISAAKIGKFGGLVREFFDGLKEFFVLAESLAAVIEEFVQVVGFVRIGTNYGKLHEV